MSKITIDRFVVEQALEALDEADLLMEHRQNIELRRSALAALRATLEQPQVEQEPIGEVGAMPGTTGFTMACFLAADAPIGTKLYANQQPKRQPLTDEAVLGVAKSIEIQFDSERLNEQIDDILVFARAIERAHGIGE